MSFIEHLHKDNKNFILLNEYVYYITPLNRLITLSHILTDMRSELIESQMIIINKDEEWNFIQ